MDKIINIRNILNLNDVQLKIMEGGEKVKKFTEMQITMLVVVLKKKKLLILFYIIILY